MNDSEGEQYLVSYIRHSGDDILNSHKYILADGKRDTVQREYSLLLIEVDEASEDISWPPGSRVLAVTRGRFVPQQAPAAVVGQRDVVIAYAVTFLKYVEY